jgi:hypothetical protein
MKNVMKNTVMMMMMMMSLSFVARAEFINGNGLLSSQTHETVDFKSLIVDGQFEVYLTYGLQPSVTIMTDENLQDAVLMDNDGTTLFIRTKENIGETSKLSVYITVSNVQQMGFKDVISVQSTNALWFNHLTLNLNMLGNTKLQLACKTLDANLEGAGDLYLSGRIEEMNVNQKGLGSLFTHDLQVEKVNMTHRGSRNFEMRMIHDKASEVKLIPMAGGNTPKA